jgi:hypothetical protein
MFPSIPLVGSKLAHAPSICWSLNYWQWRLTDEYATDRFQFDKCVDEEITGI